MAKTQNICSRKAWRGRYALGIVLLLVAGCTSTYKISKGAFPQEGGDVAADYMEMLEFHDSCWVVDSTYSEWTIDCKGRKQ